MLKPDKSSSFDPADEFPRRVFAELCTVPVAHAGLVAVARKW